MVLVLYAVHKLGSSLVITQHATLDGVQASERGAGSFLAQQDLAQLQQADGDDRIRCGIRRACC